MVLAFEDMQWADASLLDFVEYLLDWSRSYPIFVLTLARPELLERRPTWGAGQRSFTSLYLEPLSEQAMEKLLTGLVPGLPETLRAQIMARAEGVPLYAVETVRMLLDRGLLVQEGPAYRVTGAIEELEVPETLHALIAARLDGLTADERRLLQDGAVLGKSFTREALAALFVLNPDQLEPMLASLVRKEVLGVQADPRSPEHGQYGFLQDLVRHVAYETLSRRERRARHLAAAAHLSSAASDEDEVVEVIASHYLDAYEAVPDADDAEEIKAKARMMLARAGERAASLAASAEAQRYFHHAAQLTESTSEKAALLDRAGLMAVYAADPETAERLFEESIALYEERGDTHAAARVSGRLARVEANTGRLDEGLERGERAFAVISGDQPDEDLALLVARLANGYWFAGDLERAAERAELALDVSEALGFPEPLTIALRSKAANAWSRGHPNESLALLERALAIAREHDLPEDASTAYFILSDQCFRLDRYADALRYLDESLALSRRLGSRPGEWSVLAEMTYPLFMLGRWEEALAVHEELAEAQARSGAMLLSLLTSVLELHLARGDLAAARRVSSHFARLEDSADLQDQACALGSRAALCHGEGRLHDALEAGVQVIEVARPLGYGFQAAKQGLVHALEAALALGERDRALELLAAIDEIPPGQRSPYLQAHAQRFRARLDGEVAGYEAAAEAFRALGIPFWLAVALLEHAELVGDEGSRGEALEIFESLRATPWLERARAGSALQAGVE